MDLQRLVRCARLTKQRFFYGEKMLTLKEAKETGCCRICGGRIIEPGTGPTGYPAGWQDMFGEMLFPVAVTLNFGGEFAHPKCLEEPDE